MQKLRLVILACWSMSIGVTVLVACPPNKERIEAIVSPVSDRTPRVYSITNRSDTPWDDVVITVNQQFQITFARINSDESVILSPGKLFDSSGKPADESLPVKEVHIQTRHQQYRINPSGEK